LGPRDKRRRRREVRGAGLGPRDKRRRRTRSDKRRRRLGKRGADGGAECDEKAALGVVRRRHVELDVRPVSHGRPADDFRLDLLEPDDAVDVRRLDRAGGVARRLRHPAAQDDRRVAPGVGQWASGVDDPGPVSFEMRRQPVDQPCADGSGRPRGVGHGDSHRSVRTAREGDRCSERDEKTSASAQR